MNDFTHSVAGERGVDATRVPLVISGDFNTEPDSDAVARVDGSVLALESYWKTVCGGLPEQLPASATFSTWKQRKSKDPLFCGEKKRVIDYLWWRRATLQPRRLWQPLREAEIGPHALPCATYPSDHVSLLAELKF